MNRHQNRSRSRDNYNNNNNNRNRSRNTGNDYRRRDDYDRNSNRYQGGGGGGGGRRVDQGNQMSQTSVAGYSQNMGMYAGGQTQMGSYGAYGASTAFQQNRFAVSQQQMINPWANNMMPSSSMAGSGDEAKLAMNILNAVLSSSGSSPTGRGMSPPPNKMRRMDYRDGGYDDRRRRPRSPPGRSHQNRQQSSQRFGSDRRGRDGHSSYQRNDDHRFRNSFSKSPGVSRSSRQSSVESSEFVFRKRLSFDERERENKKYKELPLKTLRCHMCEKSTFQSVAAYLAHVDSKGHSKVAKAFHEKIAATTTLLKQNARLALRKELTKAKATGKKVTEKECRVCEGPMVYGNLKHKNILACKILHKFQKQTYCCGKDHKNRFMIEEHCLSLAHLKVKYEAEEPNEDNKDGSVEENNTKDGSVEESVEDEEEKMKRLKRDEARRKRKYGEDQSDEEEEDEEEEENQDDADKNNEEEEEQKKNNAEQIDTNSGGKEKSEEHNAQEQMECNEAVKEGGDEDESMETNQDKEIKDEEDKDTMKENGHNDQTENDEKEEENKEPKKGQRRNRNQNRRGGDNRSKNKNEKDDMYQGKTVKRMTMEELVEFHKISLVDDPEKLGAYDPAHPTGLNYIETHVAFHCMACIEYYPAAADDLKAHCCSKEHYDLFRSKYMKLNGVRDSPMSLKRLKNAKDKESKDHDKQTDTKEEKTKKENLAEEKEKDKPATESEDVAGDDALYDPYEGESGDLTTMLQDKESTEEQEGETLEGYEVQDEAQESEPENYEDNILDYEEDDGGDDEDKDEIKDQRETQKGNKKNKEEKKVQDDKGEEVQDDEIEEVEDDKSEVQDDENEEVQDDENEEVQDDENEEVQDDENEEVQDDENEEVQDDENEEVQDDENEEVLDDENEEVQDDENQDYQEDDEIEEDGDDQEEEMEEEEEEDEEAAPPAAPTQKGQSKRY